MAAVNFGKSLLKIAGKNSESQCVSTFLDTGFPPLNHAISGSYDGGFPVSRIVEMFGPESSGKTLIATKAMVNAQQMGGIAIFKDHEHSFDVELAKMHGLLVGEGDPWIYKSGGSFEESIDEAIAIAKSVREGKLIDPTAPIMVVYDSLASMVPKSKREKKIDGQGMHDSLALAAATSASFPLLAEYANELNMLVLFLNQIREKPGVCLRGDVMVTFVDGTTMSMIDIVENKVSKEVWSYNESLMIFEPKKIINWFNNGPVLSSKEWVHIRSTGYGTRNGVKAGTFTLDHKILEKSRGWTRASDLQVGDRVLGHAVRVINGTLKDFIGGMLFGDSSLRKISDNRMTAQLILQDNNDPKYVEWKVSKVSPALGDFTKRPVSWVGGDGVRYDSQFSHELGEWVQYHRDPVAILKEFGLSDMALALWVMDDGYLSEGRRYMLSLKRVKDDNVLDEIADELYFTYGLRCRVRHREGLFTFDTASTKTISEKIAKFVPKFMDRKLLESDKGKYEDFSLSYEKDIGEFWDTVTSVRPAGESIKCKSRFNKYDITVEDNHNFLAGSVSGGFLVHNCFGDPTTTPGGKAPKFYASVRIQLSRVMIKNTAKEVIGQEITAHCIKNKVTAPFKKAKWRYMFNADGSGHFDVTGSVIDHLVDLDIITKASTRLNWDGKTYSRSQLVSKIEKDGTYNQLLALLPKVKVA